MAPKAAKSAAPKKAAAANASHASYVDMIKEAILNLKERNGSSRQAIKKYIQANNNLGGTSDAAFTSHLSRALASGESAGTFTRPKGPSGTVKLGKKGDKPDVPVKSTTTKKAATPKKEKAEKAEKKPAVAKKAAGTKRTAAKKAAPAKKTAAKPKANTSKKASKTAPPAPAVEDKPPVILGKTKSGRVTKTKAPAAASAPKKRAATKKAPAKKATPKKSATPKKAEANAEA